MKAFFLTTFFVSAALTLFSQGSCATSVELINDPVNYTQYCFNNSGAVDNTLDNSNCFAGGQWSADAWINFTIASGPQTIEIDLSDFGGNGPNTNDMAFEVFSGNCGALSSLACVNDFGNNLDENVTLTDLPNGTYSIAIYSDLPIETSYDICITVYPETPANDECIDAIPISVGSNGICSLISGTNEGATDSSGEVAPSCGGYLGGDVWYSITVPASGEVNFSVDFSASNALSDVDMAIYSGSCGSLTEIDCDDFSGTGLMPSIQATGLVPGSTVYIRLWEYLNNSFGDFELCVSEPPATLNNQDCSSAITICSNSTFGGASNGSGSADLNSTNDGCLNGENQSSWLTFTVSFPGDLEFTISPTNGTDDYDFALWHYPVGTSVSCPPAANDVDRCSWAAGAGLNGSYDTGLGQGETDASEGATGNNWVAPLTGLNPGDVIYLVIDNFSVTTSPYTLDFTGSTVGLDCTLLPTEMLSFFVKTENNTRNLLYWSTVSEINNDFFTLEHSVDGINWRVIGKVNGSGNSNERVEYTYTHENIEKTINYYRIHQTDYDGKISDYRIISIDNTYSNGIVLYTTNLLGQKVDATYKGIVIDVLSNGRTVKRMQH